MKRRTRPGKTGKKRRWENNPRFLKFQKIYLQEGNAYQSMLKAGYSEATASSDCSILKARVEADLARIMRANEVDEWRVARKYGELLDVQCIQGGERMPAADVQLKVVNEVRKILEPGVVEGKRGHNIGPGLASTVVIVTQCPRPDRSKQNTKVILKEPEGNQ